MKVKIPVYIGEGIGQELFQALSFFSEACAIPVQFEMMTSLEVQKSGVLATSLPDHFELQPSDGIIHSIYFKSNQKIILVEGFQATFNGLHEIIFDVLQTENVASEVCFVHLDNDRSIEGQLFIRLAAQFAFKQAELLITDANLKDYVMSMSKQKPKASIFVFQENIGQDLTGLTALLFQQEVMATRKVKTSHGETFVPQHGCAKDIAQMGIANPIAFFRAFAELLNHVNFQKESKCLLQAIDFSLKNKDFCTVDVGGSLNTLKFTERIIENYKPIFQNEK